MVNTLTFLSITSKFLPQVVLFYLSRCQNLQIPSFFLHSSRSSFDAYVSKPFPSIMDVRIYIDVSISFCFVVIIIYYANLKPLFCEMNHLQSLEIPIHRNGEMLQAP